MIPFILSSSIRAGLAAFTTRLRSVGHNNLSGSL